MCRARAEGALNLWPRQWPQSGELSQLPLPGERAQQLKGYLLVAAGATFWGVAGVLIKFLFNTRDVDPLTLVQFRSTLTAPILGLALALFSPRLLKVRLANLPLLALFGFACFAAVQLPYYYAIRLSSVAVAIFLEYLAPVITAFYEIVVLKRRPGRMTFVVLGLAIAGSLLLVLGRGGSLNAPPLAVATGVLSAFTMAFYSLVGRRGVERFSPWTLLFWGSLFAAIGWAFYRPPWVLLAGPWAGIDWAFFLYLAVFSSIIPFGLNLMGLRYISATSAILTGTLEPVWATVLAAVFLGEGLGLGQAVGCLLILAAIVALQVLPGAALGERAGG